MKVNALCVMISLAFASVLCTASPAAATHQSLFAPPAEKKLFTKHFNESLFDITTHADYSVEVLLNDKEYPIGTNTTGIIIHNFHDQDVKGADLTIVQKDVQTGKDIPLKPSIKDRHNGLYIVSGLNLKRKGKWELVITVDKDGVKDSASFAFPGVLKKRYPKGRYSP